MSALVRALKVAASVSALGVCAAAAASEGVSKLTPKAAAAVQAASGGETAIPAASGVKAVKDRSSGQLRAPTPEEAAELSQDGPPRRVTTVRVNSDGSVTAALGDEHLSDVIAVRNPDGTLSTACLPKEKSAAALSAPVQTSAALETE